MTGGPGTLRAIGVGPGDPELLTLRAVRLLARAEVVAYPAANGAESLARGIAAAHLPPGIREIGFAVPMRPGGAAARAAYDAASAAIAAELAAGRDVALLCEGDPSFYGSAMQILARLASRFPAEVVPGVSALGAAAAAAGRPLAARDEVLTVVPGTLPAAELAPRIAAGPVAILKAGRHLGRVRAAVAAAGRLGEALYVERASMAGGRVLPLAAAPDPAPYFALILLPGEAPPWRP